MTDITTDLPEATVDVWYARVEPELSADRVAALRPLLDAAELARADRFIFDRHRQLYTVAHALVRTTLSRYLAGEPTAWEFSHNNYGRPELVESQNPLRLRFNLSHTTGMAVCAVTRDLDLGVDVENGRRRDVSENVARRFFAEPEVAALERVPPGERLQAFLNFWTLKESYIKARGMGLAIPLAHFWFTPPDEPVARIAFSSAIDDRAEAWQFARTRLLDEFPLAVSLRCGTERNLQARYFDATSELV